MKRFPALLALLLLAFPVLSAKGRINFRMPHPVVRLVTYEEVVPPDPPQTNTLATINLAQTFSAVQTFSAGGIFGATLTPPTGACGTATGVICIGENTNTCTPTLGQACLRADYATHQLFVTENGAPEGPLTGGIAAPVDTTNLSAAIAATNLINSAPRTGFYKICFSASVVTAATTSSTIGGANGFQIIFTAPSDMGVNTTVSNAAFSSSANTITTAVGGCQAVYALIATPLQYSFGYTSSGATAMVYEIHIREEDLY